MDLSALRKERDVDLNASPQALDRLLGYVLAFKVKVQPKFRNVVVLRYSNELDLINDVVDMLPDTEVLFFYVYFSCFCHSDIMYAFGYSQVIYHAGMFQRYLFQTLIAMMLHKLNL